MPTSPHSPQESQLSTAAPQKGRPLQEVRQGLGCLRGSRVGTPLAPKDLTPGPSAGSSQADWPARPTTAGAAPPTRPTLTGEGGDGATVGLTQAPSKKGQEKANHIQLSKVARGGPSHGQGQAQAMDKGTSHPQGWKRLPERHPPPQRKEAVPGTGARA